MTTAEPEDLRAIVVPRWLEALSAVLRCAGQPIPYRENVSILGNSTPHLHAHLVPRYTESVELFGTRFVDERPHRHHKVQDREALPDETTQAIRRSLSLGEARRAGLSSMRRVLE